MGMSVLAGIGLGAAVSVTADSGMEVMLAVAVLSGLAFSVPAAEAVAMSSTDGPFGPHDANTSPSAATPSSVVVSANL